MKLSDINKAIAACNPYTDKEHRRYLVVQRRIIERQNDRDIKSGNIPAMLKAQA